MISIKDEMLGGGNVDLNKTFSRAKYLIKKNIQSNLYRISNKQQQESSNNNNNTNKKLKNNNNNYSKKNNSSNNNNNENNIKKTKFKCNHFDDTPEHLQREYVLNGYRVDFSIWLAFKSMFIPKHNDFANIHSHFIPALYFCYLIYDVILSENSTKIYKLHSTLDYLAFGIFLLSGLTTFICSTLYHTFGCHSFKTYTKLLLCDYLGIIFLIGSSFYPSLIYAFKNSPPLMSFYCGTITLLCASLIVFVLVPSFSNSNKLRNILFVLTSSFGIVPTIHIFMTIEYDDSIIFIKRIIMLFALYGTGLLIYIFKIPERWFPGKLDNIITSHAIWHIFVFIAPLYHLQTCFLANEKTLYL